MMVYHGLISMISNKFEYLLHLLISMKLIFFLQLDRVLVLQAWIFINITSIIYTGLCFCTPVIPEYGMRKKDSYKIQGHPQLCMELGISLK